MISCKDDRSEFGREQHRRNVVLRAGVERPLDCSSLLVAVVGVKDARLVVGFKF